VRVLGIDTSSRRGSIALLSSGTEIVTRTYEGAGTHAERALDLVNEVLAEAGWPRTTLDRIAVGVGPGSFTGLRVGISLAQGMGLGLDRPVLGIGALQAMCRAVPAASGVGGLLCALIDARRDEVFAAAYDAGAREQAAVVVLPRLEVAGWVSSLRDASGAEPLVLGEVARELGLPGAVFASERTDLPHAAAVALLGMELSPEAAPPEPAYVRPPDAIRPNLPRSPLSSEEPT
jgi:tRNA threonylcarbamoyladenosine biosynthesis protein TsaB